MKWGLFFCSELPTPLHIGRMAKHHAGQRASFASNLEAWWVKNKLETILVGIQVAYAVLGSWRRCRSLFLLWIRSVTVDGLQSAARQRIATSTHFQLQLNMRQERQPHLCSISMFSMKTLPQRWTRTLGRILHPLVISGGKNNLWSNLAIKLISHPLTSSCNFFSKLT